MSNPHYQIIKNQKLAKFILNCSYTFSIIVAGALFGFAGSRLIHHNSRRRCIINSRSKIQMNYMEERNKYLEEKKKEIQREIFLRKKREERIRSYREKE